MKKGFYFLFMISFLFSACSAPVPSSSISNEPIVTENQESTINTNDITLTTVSSDYGVLMDGIAYNNDGAYEILVYNDGTGRIIYYDFKTMQKVFLSSQINDNHDDINSPAYIESVVGGAYPICANNSLYILKAAAPTLGEKPYISQMDLNGANAIKYNLPDNYILNLGSAVLSDSDNIYAMHYIISQEENEIKSRTALVKINVKKQEYEDYLIFEDVAERTIIGSYENYVVFLVSKISENNENVTTSIEIADLNTKETRHLMEVTPNEIVFDFYEDSIYTIKSNDTVLNKTNIVTGVTTKVADIDAELKEEERISFIDGIVDDWFFYQIFPQENAKTYIFNLNSKESTEFSIRHESNGGMKISGVFGKNNDKYMILSGFNKQIIEWELEDGQIMSGEQYFANYNMIAKEDYINNINNQIEFEHLN